MGEFSSGPIAALSISPAGTHLALATDQSLSIAPFPAPTTSPLKLTNASALTTPASSISALCHAGPDAVYTATTAGSLARYAVDGAPSLSYETPSAHGAGVELTGVAAVGRGGVVVTSGKDAFVRVWDAETRQSVARLAGHKYEVRAVSVAESESAGEVVHVVASAGRDKTVRLWDVRAKESAGIHVFSGHAGWVHDVAISGGGGRNVVVSCAGDKTVRVWDLKMMREARVFSGHEYRVWGVSVARDGSFAISGSTDATVRAWNLAEDVEGEDASFVFNGHRDSVISVAVSADGACGVSGSEDGSVYLWDTSTLFGRTVESTVAAEAGTVESESVPAARSEPRALPIAEEGDLLGFGFDPDAALTPTDTTTGSQAFVKQAVVEEGADVFGIFGGNRSPLASCGPQSPLFDAVKEGVVDDGADVFGIFGGNRSPLASPVPRSPLFDAKASNSDVSRVVPASRAAPAAVNHPASDGPFTVPAVLMSPEADKAKQVKSVVQASKVISAPPTTDLKSTTAPDARPAVSESEPHAPKSVPDSSVASACHVPSRSTQAHIVAINKRLRTISSRVDSLLAADVS